MAGFPSPLLATLCYPSSQQASEAKIRELITALDMRKDEAIERTFKGVAKNFREVFADLVPGRWRSAVEDGKRKGKLLPVPVFSPWWPRIPEVSLQTWCRVGGGVGVDRGRVRVEGEGKGEDVGSSVPVGLEREVAAAVRFLGEGLGLGIGWVLGWIIDSGRWVFFWYSSLIIGKCNAI